MRYRRFGRTGIDMPVISTGGMRYQDGWKDKPLTEVDPAVQKNLEATIARSIEVGINHIETARGYGVSERQLGTVLPGYPRDELIVQTKIGPEDDPALFTANLMESLERLRLDYVDLLAIHGINDDTTLNQSIREGGCLDAARELQRKGLCRHVGFSTHGPLRVILGAIHADPRDAPSAFDYFNVHWYYIMRRNWPAIEAATKLDMGVFIISPTDKGGRLWDPSPDLVELCDPLHPIVFNDLWCLQHPEVHTLSLGSAKPSDYDLHLQAVERMDRAGELVPPIDEKLKTRMREKTGLDHPEGMNAGLPDPEDTPGGLNLEVMLWLRHLAVGWGMQAYGKSRFNLLGNGGHWFPGSPVDKDTKLDIEAVAKAVAGLPHADTIPALVAESQRLLAGEAVKRLSES
ncbi:MAG: aldo/keto reductase [Phycisphaeraceae bacterium]